MASHLLGSSGEILVAVDSEGRARDALIEAIRLGKVLGRHVHVIHAIGPRRSVSMRGSTEETERARVRAGAVIRNMLLELADRGGGAPSMEIATGHPVAVVLDTIERRKPALLVIGRHGAGRRREILLGQTASRLVRGAPCPVLIRRGPSTPGAPILVPVDLSPESLAALDLGAHIAGVSAAPLDSLFVYQPPDFVEETGDPSLDYVVEDERDAMIAEYREAVRTRGLTVPVRTLVGEGEPAAVIAEKARELGSDLVIIGTHGRTGLVRWALGSVAEALVERSDLSLITVKLEDRDFMV